MKTPTRSGPLVIIGGAEDKKGECDILRRFVELGGTHARLVVLTIASDYPDLVGREYTQIFERLGVRKVRALDVRTRDQASNTELLSELEKATAIFFTGGDQ